MFAVVLPSGARARVSVKTGSPPPASLPEALERGLVEADVDLLASPMVDANTVEAILVAREVIVVERAKIECRNCAQIVDIDPTGAIAIEPLLAPLGDPELDRVLLGDQEHPFPTPVSIRGESAQTFRLSPRTLADRVHLEGLLGDDPDAPLPLGPALVRAVGLAAIGTTESPSAIARALGALDDREFDRAWDAIAEAWDRQHWSPRTLVATPCPNCGARHDLEIGGPRPLGFGGLRREDGAAPFPSLSSFRAAARRIAEEILRDEPEEFTAGLDVAVDDGVPPCDDGGEPLLGSYTPMPDPRSDAQEPVGAPFRIELFYGTFRSLYADEPYDVDAEIRETIEHELEHHEGFLRGHDPLDEEERLEIERERTRLRGGKVPRVDEVTRGLGWLAGDFGRFIRVMWPVLLIAAALTLVVTTCGR